MGEVRLTMNLKYGLGDDYIIEGTTVWSELGSEKERIDIWNNGWEWYNKNSIKYITIIQKEMIVCTQKTKSITKMD